MANKTIFSLPQISQHKSPKDCWLVINGKVLDVTKFLDEHPGGSEVLMETAGKDATKDFQVIGHSKAAKKQLLKYQIGLLQGFQEVEDDKEDSVQEETQREEMTAFVLKDGVPKSYLKIVELFVPALVACFFFGYRVLTRDTDEFRASL